MIVYILLHEYFYEGSELIGVYATKELAIEAAKEYCNKGASGSFEKLSLKSYNDYDSYSARTWSLDIYPMTVIG